MDARRLSTAQRYQCVSAAFEGLAGGAELRIVTDHEPRVLRLWFSKLYAGRYVWTQRKLSEEYWEAAVQRCVSLERGATPIEGSLHSSWLCNELAPAARKVLAAAAISRRLCPGTTVVEQGATWPHLGLVTRGSIVATVGTDAGRDYVLYEAAPFDVFGEIAALDSGVTIARFDAGMRDTEILMLPREVVLGLADVDGRFARRLATICAQRGRLLHETLHARVAKPTITRLAAAILPYAIRCDGFEAPLPPLSDMTQSQLARAAGTVKDVTGRDLAALQAAGAIELRLGRIAQINEARLRTFL